MEATSTRSPPLRNTTTTTIQFPLNLNCSTSTHDHQNASTPSDDERTVINEMDFFFADKKHRESVAATSTAVDADRKLDLTDNQCDFNVNTGLHLLTANTSSDQSMVDDGISPNSEDKRVKTELAVLQAELERMKVENQRLRDMLNHITTNYNALQMHIPMSLMQQQQRRQQHQPDQKPDDREEHDQNNTAAEENKNKKHVGDGGGGEMAPRQFIDLGLAGDTEERSLSSSEGRSPLENNVEEASAAASKELYHYDHGREGSPEDASISNQSPSKAARLSPLKSADQAAAEATMRKARVSVRARSEAPMISDGCQWRKYGQKMAKGNPCPRAYYRCTMAAGCPVRKQVQRSAEDKTILVTTYEGSHNHPLPPAAMAMAATTSSAARMLLSGSMPSADGLMNSNFLPRNLFPFSSSLPTISASAPFPTVTLDLTQNATPLHFQRPPPPNSFHQLPFPNTTPNLAAAVPAALLPQIFGQQPPFYNQSKFSGLQMSQDAIGAAQFGQQPPPPPVAAVNQAQQNSLADTVNALTADPNFTAALAAAISSLIGGGGHPNNGGGGNNSGGGATKQQQQQQWQHIYHQQQQQ
ncbi:hypothetical protein U1Q18_047613 [Sarracenia purpurea var. burkii]